MATDSGAWEGWPILKAILSNIPHCKAHSVDPELTSIQSTAQLSLGFVLESPGELLTMLMPGN